MILFWADTHFNHEGIIRHCGRPYDGVAQMNLGLTLRWNSVVRPQDTVYLLGDFAFSSATGWPLKAIFDQLNGHKHLVVGNHDERNPKVTRLPWESVKDFVTVRDHEMRAVCAHYPHETWKGAHRGYLMLHGHCHGTLKRTVPHRFDVGADVWDTPVSFEDLWAKAALQRWAAADHHGDL